MSPVSWALIAGAALAAAYAALLGGLFAMMRRPPPQFGRFMKHVPMPALLLVPFRPLWFIARRGSAAVGTLAPDFALPAVGGGETVRLSSFRHRQPVVLVFGSYT
jgi:hypothetical protein